MLKRSLLAFLAAGAICAPAAAEISISSENGVWRVSAEGESLQQVVERLAEDAGFRITGGDRLSAGPGLNGVIEGDLRSVAERLLRGRDYALVFGETPETADELRRIVVLSGRVGDMPAVSEPRAAAPAPAPSRPLTGEESERVSALLARQIQPMLDAEAERDVAETTTPAGAGGDQPPADPAGVDDALDPDTQAALAAATQQAQADLEALVNALRQHEDGGGLPD